MEKSKNPPSIQESLQRLSHHQAEMAKFNEAQDAWAPRSIMVGTHVPASGRSEEYDVGTPERTLVKFLELWQEGNYGRMAQMTTQSWDDTVGKRAGSYRRIFGGKLLNSYRILDIKDQASALERITVSLDITADGKTVRLEHGLDLIYLRDENDPVPRGHAEGTWRISERFSEIEFLDGALPG